MSQAAERRGAGGGGDGIGGGAAFVSSPTAPLPSPIQPQAPQKSVLMTLSGILTIQNRLCIHCARESNVI